MLKKGPDPIPIQSGGHKVSDMRVHRLLMSMDDSLSHYMRRNVILRDGTLSIVCPQFLANSESLQSLCEILSVEFDLIPRNPELL